MNFNRTIADTEIITVQEAKAHLVVTSSDDDLLIRGLIKGTIMWVENYIERSLLDSTWTAKYDRFPKRNWSIILPYGPVRSLTSLTYYDSGNALQTLTEGTHFYLDKDSNLARLVAIDSWPDTFDRPNAVTATYKAGYFDDSTDPITVTTPQDIIDGIMITIADKYEVRQSIIIGNVVNHAYINMSMFDPYKVHWYASEHC